MDYLDIVYDQSHNSSFSEKIELIHYNASLAITSAIRNTLREKFYQELGLEYLISRKLLRQISLFQNI